MLQSAIESPEQRRQRRIRDLRRRRLRRGTGRAYIRSVQFLPSLATLGNALCGFAAIYIVTLDPTTAGPDPLTGWLVEHRFIAAVYLIGVALLFDAIDGRLARFARATTDFGGQLDSLADAISFGVAPAIVALHVFKFHGAEVPLAVSRLIWAIGALYVACSLLRLARFNVSNEHGEQAHMSFLGLPSPGAAAAVLGVVLVQQDLLLELRRQETIAIEQGLEAAGATGATLFALETAYNFLTFLLPLVLLTCGLLMISTFRYPHLINRYMRGTGSIPKLVGAVVVLLALVVAHRYVLGLAGLVIAYSGPAVWFWAHRGRSRAEAGPGDAGDNGRGPGSAAPRPPASPPDSASDAERTGGSRPHDPSSAGSRT